MDVRAKNAVASCAPKHLTTTKSVKAQKWDSNHKDGCRAKVVKDSWKKETRGSLMSGRFKLRGIIAEAAALTL